MCVKSIMVFVLGYDVIGLSDGMNGNKLSLLAEPHFYIFTPI